MQTSTTWKRFRSVLANARQKDIDVIKMHVEDFYDLLDIMPNNRIAPVKSKDLLHRGFYGHIDGFNIFCNKKSSTEMFGKYQLGKNTNRSCPEVSSSHDPDIYITEEEYFSLFDWDEKIYDFESFNLANVKRLDVLTEAIKILVSNKEFAEVLEYEKQ